MDNIEKTKEQVSKIFVDLKEIDIAEIAIVLVAAWVAIAVVRRFVPKIADYGPNRLRQYLLAAVPLFRLFVIVLAILLIIPLVFNVNLQNLIVIAGAASVALGFAFKDYVSNIVAGIVAIIERPYRQGDWVRIKDSYGQVISIGTRALRMVTPSDDVVTVPHDLIWKENIANSNDGTSTLMCVADFYIHPDHDAAKLREALKLVALTSAFVSYEKPVKVMLAQTPLATHYKVKAYPFDLRDQFDFISDITVRAKAAIKATGAVEVSTIAIDG